jgi:DNA polymerase III subunit gamma/tau
VDRLSNEGRDLGQFLGELISHLRNLMLLPHAPEVALAEVGAEERGPLEEQASNIPTAEVVRLIEALGDALGRIKRGGEPKTELELSFLKLTRDYTEPSVENLLRRLEALELAIGRAPESAPEENPVAETAGSGAIQEAQESEETEDTPGGQADLAAQWGALMQDLRDRRQAPAAAVYEEARVEGFDGAVLELTFPDELSIYATLARDARHADPLREAIQRRFGVSPRVECRVADEAADEAGTSLLEEGPSRRADDPQIAHSGDDGAAGADDRRRVSGEVGGDDVIRDQREVFEMARERLDPRDPGGES